MLRSWMSGMVPRRRLSGTSGRYELLSGGRIICDVPCRKEVCCVWLFECEKIKANYVVSNSLVWFSIAARFNLS